MAILHRPTHTSNRQPITAIPPKITFPDTRKTCTNSQILCTSNIFRQFHRNTNSRLSRSSTSNTNLLRTTISPRPALRLRRHHLQDYSTTPCIRIKALYSLLNTYPPFLWTPARALAACLREISLVACVSAPSSLPTLKTTWGSGSYFRILV